LPGDLNVKACDRPRTRRGGSLHERGDIRDRSGLQLADQGFDRGAMRMSMRRFTRLTNGFSKKLENLQAAVSLHFAHYNFVRQHKTLRVTPAMAAGVSDRMWSLEELVEQTS
jgi:hypothetical protein